MLLGAALLPIEYLCEQIQQQQRTCLATAASVLF